MKNLLKQRDFLCLPSSCCLPGRQVPGGGGWLVVPATCHGFGFEGWVVLQDLEGSPGHCPPSLLLSFNCPSGPFVFLSEPLCCSAALSLNQGFGLHGGTLSCSGFDLGVCVLDLAVCGSLFPPWWCALHPRFVVSSRSQLSFRCLSLFQVLVLSTSFSLLFSLRRPFPASLLPRSTLPSLKRGFGRGWLSVLE